MSAASSQFHSSFLCAGVTDFALLQVMQCSSDIQGLTAALAALQGTRTKSEQVWVHRPGGLVLGLGHDRAIQVLKDGMHADCFALPKGTLRIQQMCRYQLRCMQT